ncbi:MAG: Wzz/FepE/Etk N-terminal domain-containing protein [Alteromonadaceae bacterium]
MSSASTQHTYHQPSETQDDEIDLAELWRAIWQGKFLIAAISLFFTVSSVIYAINQPNIYKASTLLAPAGEQGGAGGLAKMAGQFGGLASLAGINLGGGSTDKTGLALAVIQSRAFIEKFITKHALLAPLMAAKNWDSTTNTLILDENLYDSQSKKWIGDVKTPKKPEPSPWASFKKFSGLMSISQDKETGMVTLEIEHYSPQVATQWLLWLVEDINTNMREQDKRVANNSINFLTRKLEQIQVADMQTVFYQLIEEQTKTVMLAEVSKEYVFITIDPANAPDGKVKPKRAIIVVLGTMLGGMLSVLIVLIRHFSTSKKLTKPEDENLA